MSAPLCTELELEREELPATPASIDFSRRSFVAAAAAISAATVAGLPGVALAQNHAGAEQNRSITLKVNGTAKTLNLDTRTTLLDALRENIDLTGSKKGCDHGQCGACTVLMNGRRVNSCLTLAFAAEGADIVTIEGLARGEGIGGLHPMQASFLEHDGFQCGYCTPGQICSAVALVEEARRGELSIVSYQTGHDQTGHAANLQMSDDEIRERMSGNICRCGAYPNIVAAVRAEAKAQLSQGGAA